MKKTIRLLPCVLFIQWLLCMSLTGYADDETRAHLTLAASQGPGHEGELPPRVTGSEFVEGLVPGLGEWDQKDRAFTQRIAVVLQKLGKTLILEHTRGTKEVAIYRTAAPAVVLVLPDEKSFGSGAVLDAQGHVITNWHVVKNRRQVVVVIKPRDSTELKKENALLATIEKVDEVTDLALLRISTPPQNIPFLRLGDVSSLAVGQDVHAIGHPEGEVWTYTKGIVSQIRENYEWTTSSGPPHRARVIQTQTPVNPGNSGGPLLDDTGRLVGINSFRRSGEGLNYAVAIDVVQEFLRRQESRALPPAKRAGVDRRRPRCLEAYDTTGQGRRNIEGCYLAAIAPPPDLWIVYPSLRNIGAYGALGMESKLAIDTVILSQDQEGQILGYHMDVDCDGTIDLIGYQKKGSAEIESYRVPDHVMRTDILALELDSAFKGRKVPYPALRVCQ